MKKPSSKRVGLTKQEIERENGLLRTFIAKYAAHLDVCAVNQNQPLCTCGYNDDLRKLRDAARGNIQA